jgi:pyridoxine/pyridoxamine 5'-phosphate oxidase
VAEPNEDIRRELQEHFKKQLSSYVTMALATADGRGFVDCATVYYAFDDSGIIYFASDTVGVRKIVNLRENNRAAAVMDDGGRTARGIQIRGRVEELLHPAAADNAKKLLEARVPSIGEYLRKPSVRFFRLIPGERYLINFAWGLDWRRQVPF